MKVKLCCFVELLNEEWDNKALPDRQTDDFTLRVNKLTVHFTAAILSLSISLGAVNVLFIKDEHRNHIVCHQIVEFTFGWFSTSATPFNNEGTIAWPLLICLFVLLNYNLVQSKICTATNFLTKQLAWPEVTAPILES